MWKRAVETLWEKLNNEEELKGAAYGMECEVKNTTLCECSCS